MSKCIKELNTSNYEDYLANLNQHNHYHAPGLNVLKADYCLWRPRNWFRNIRQFFRNIKYAYQRITHGYCDRDTWWMDGYIANVFADMLDDLSVHSCGYPGFDEYTTPEAWFRALQEKARIIRTIEDDDDKLIINPHPIDWLADTKDEEELKLYYEAEREKAQTQTEMQAELLDWLKKWYSALWY